MKDFVLKIAPNYMKMFDKMFHVFQGYFYLLEKNKYRNFDSSLKSLTVNTYILAMLW